MGTQGQPPHVWIWKGELSAPQEYHIVLPCQDHHKAALPLLPKCTYVSSGKVCSPHFFVVKTTPEKTLLKNIEGNHL